MISKKTSKRYDSAIKLYEFYIERLKYVKYPLSREVFLALKNHPKSFSASPTEQLRAHWVKQFAKNANVSKKLLPRQELMLEIYKELHGIKQRRTRKNQV